MLSLFDSVNALFEKVNIFKREQDQKNADIITQMSELKLQNAELKAQITAQEEALGFLLLNSAGMIGEDFDEEYLDDDSYEDEESTSTIDTE